MNRTKANACQWVRQRKVERKGYAIGIAKGWRNNQINVNTSTEMLISPSFFAVFYMFYSLFHVSSSTFTDFRCLFRRRFRFDFESTDTVDMTAERPAFTFWFVRVHLMSRQRNGWNPVLHILILNRNIPIRIVSFPVHFPVIDFAFSFVSYFFFIIRQAVAVCAFSITQKSWLMPFVWRICVCDAPNQTKDKRNIKCTRIWIYVKWNI